MSSYKFNGLDINVKKFNSVYELTDIYIINFDRLVVSAAVICNKSDVRYFVGYKTEEGRVIPLISIMKILHEKWVWIFPMMKNGWKIYDFVERNRGVVRRRPRECCEK